jgi:hypothetical protein
MRRIFAVVLAVSTRTLYVHGVDGWAVWNLTPVAAALVAAVVATTARDIASGARTLGLMVFAITELLCVGLLHLAWQFDLGSTATGSSTAGLILFSLPRCTRLCSAL